MADVFLSYSRRDSKDFVLRVVAALAERDKDAWVDLEDIPPASQFMEDLKEGIGGSDAFCFVLSPAALESEYCARELEYAVERNKRIIPIAHRPPGQPPPEPLASLSWVPQEGAFEDDFDGALDELVEALDTDIDWVRGHTLWGQRADGWDRGGRDRSALLRGQELREAESWLAGQGSNAPAATPLHTEFLLMSQRESRGRQRRTLIAVAAALVISLVLAGVAFWQRSEAIAQRDRAASRALAANAFRVDDPTLTVLLAEASLERADTTEADAALRGAVSDLGRLRAFTQGGIFSGVAVSDDGTIFTGQRTGVLTAYPSEEVGAHGYSLGEPVVVATLPKSTPVAAMALSRDGQRLAVAGDTGPLRIYTRDGTEKSTLTTPSPPNRLAFSPDGALLAAGGTDGAVTLWNIDTARQVGTLSAGDETVQSIAFSPDGQTILTSGNSGLVQIRRVGDGSEIFSAPGVVAALSPDGTRVAVANGSTDLGMITVYDIVSKKPLLTFRSGTENHSMVAFSPDGTQIVAALNNGAIRLHNSATGASLANLSGHTATVQGFVFTSDGHFGASVSLDATLRVWETTSDSDDIVSFPAGNGAIWSARFSPDGSRVAMGADGVRVFDSRSGEQLLAITTGSIVLSTAFSPDGSKIATAEEDGRARVWDAETGFPISEFTGHGRNSVLAVAFSPDGTAVASTATGDPAAARMWSAADGSEIREFVDPDALADAPLILRDVEFSPDGATLATGTEDGARIWDVTTGERKLLFSEHGGAVSGVAFAPSGEHISTAGPDGTVRTWDPHTGDESVVSRIENGAPIRVRASFDGHYAIAGYSTSRAAVLELTHAQFSGGAAATMGGYDGRVPAVDFSPVDYRAVAADENGLALLDECEVCLPIDEIRKRASGRVVRELTDDERRRYVADN